MRSLLLCLLPLLADDQAANRFFDRIRFDKPDADSEEGRRIVALLLQKEHWTGAYRAIEEKFGSFFDDAELSVDFNLEGEELGRTEVRGRQCRIGFNLKKLVEYRKTVEDLERQKKEARGQGKRMEFKVPPVQFDRIIYHEMTHVFQQGCEGPNWFVEGMAQLIGDDPVSMRAFAADGKPVKNIGVPISDRVEIYARGHTFWKWLDSVGSARKTVELTVGKHQPWKDALVEATGFTWETILLMEQAWSKKELQREPPPYRDGR